MTANARKLSSNEDSGLRPLPRPRTVPRSVKTPGVVDQVRIAFKRQNRLAAMMGCLLGGFVPVATFVTAHAGWTWLTGLLTAGGLLFSARTVYAWCSQAFAERVKAVGFVLLLEGVMVTSPTAWLAYAALAYLVGINAVATGCQLARR